MELYLNGFVASFLLTALITPFVWLAARRWRLLDWPDERKIHRFPVPRLGGVAIYLSLLASALIFLPDGHLLALLLPATAIFLLGLWDDLFGLAPAVKLAGQVGAALLLVALGVKIQFLTNPLGGMIFLGPWALPATLFWVVSVTNVVNLTDGLDGLAAGVAFIVAAALFSVALSMDQAGIALWTAILGGATLGFLPYNFNPAKIFLGDSGAMLIGFMLAALAAEGALKGATAVALLVPTVALGVPILDTAFAIVRRFWQGRPIYRPDREHLHHRLLSLGLSQRQAVAVIYAVSAFLGGVAVVLARQGGDYPFFWSLFGVAAGMVWLAKVFGLLELEGTEPKLSWEGRGGRRPWGMRSR
ncbi:MAG: MraY family glycosyltransferase [Bacillota bacterium]|nr:MraY family glycosyltransferase [Bacillota bacterium]